MSIVRITLPEPHVPLRYASPEKVHPNFAYKDLEIWSPGNVTPATVPIGWERRILTVYFNNERGTVKWGENWALVGSMADSPIVFAPYSFSKIEGNVAVFSVEMIPESPVIPWGIDGAVSWRLTLNGLDQQKLPETSLKIFAVVKDIAPYYMKERIPVEFLEYMVLPSDKANLKSLSGWQQWVTNRCFGSKFDTVFQAEVQKKYNDFECIHSYRYATYFGGPSFTYGNYQTVFDLDGWLQKCQPRANDQFETVNCYDQSALLQAALALGTPFTLADSEGKPILNAKGKTQQSFGRMWKSPFGFIPKADLIGWGWCDSPFFQAGKKTQLFTPESENAEPMSIGRTLFANHSFTYIRSPDAGETYQVLDSCAGPADQLTDLATYVKEHIDLNATFSMFNKEAYFKLPGHEGWTQDDKKRWTEYTLAHAADAKPFDGIISTVTQPVVPNPLPMAIPPYLLDRFSGLKVPAPKAGETAYIIPADPKKLIKLAIDSLPGYTENPDNFDIEDIDPDIGADGTSFEVDIFQNDGSETVYLSIGVHVLTNFPNAIDWAADYLGSFDHSLGGIYNVDGQQSGDNRFFLPPQSPVGESLLVLNNIFITLSGSCGSDAINTVITKIESILQGIKKEKQPTSWNDHTVSFYNEQQVGSSFEVEITASGITDIEADWENGYVLSLQEPVQDPKDRSKWTMQCLARGSAGARQGDFQDKLFISYAHDTTYFTMSKEYPITIKPAPAT